MNPYVIIKLTINVLFIILKEVIFMEKSLSAKRAEELRVLIATVKIKT